VSWLLLVRGFTKASAICGCLFCFTPKAIPSLLDAQFRKQQLNLAQERTAVAGDNLLGTLYRKGLAQSMSTRCRWFPSDSEYLNLASRKCGFFWGTSMALGRFMLEADAYKLTADSVNDSDRIRFVDFEVNCLGEDD